MADPNPNPNSTAKISAYYQTRAAHHGVVSSDWLAQAQAAVGRNPDTDDAAATAANKSQGQDPPSDKPFSVIDEFDNWRKQPDLAEAVAAIRGLAAVIRNSKATTMMELEIELKKASDSLKVSTGYLLSLTDCHFDILLLLKMQLNFPSCYTRGMIM
ncbi:hypothetical protein LINPERPRIM_LOCUS19566 [Linum perenne]